MVSSSGACCRILSGVLNPRGAAHPHSLSICQMWSCCQENQIFKWCQLQARDNQWFHSGQTLSASGEGKELVACNGVTDYAAVVCHCSLIPRFCSVQKWTAPHVSLIMLLWFVIVHWYSDSVVFRNGQLHMCHWLCFCGLSLFIDTQILLCSEMDSFTYATCQTFFWATEA